MQPKIEIHFVERDADPMLGRFLGRVALLERNDDRFSHAVDRILRPGGILVGELPNFNSWDARLFGRYWGGGHAPRHLWHFSPQTLRQAFERFEFEAIEIAPAIHTGHWELSIQNALRRKRSDCKNLVSGRTWYYPFLLVLTVPINALQMPLLQTGIMSFRVRKKR